MYLYFYFCLRLCPSVYFFFHLYLRHCLQSAISAACSCRNRFLYLHFSANLFPRLHIFLHIFFVGCR